MKEHTISLTSDELYEIEALLTKRKSEILSSSLYWNEKLMAASADDSIKKMGANMVLMEMTDAHDRFNVIITSALVKVEQARRGEQ